MSSSLRHKSSICTACTAQVLRSTQCYRTFSSTASLEERRVSQARRKMLNWLSHRGQKYANPGKGEPNYLQLAAASTEHNAAVSSQRKADAAALTHPTGLEDRPGGRSEMITEDIRDSNKELKKPFPLNPFFISEPVLPPQYRERIWQKVMMEGKTVRNVSVEMGVDMRRVGAVVRMMEIEKKWKREGKELAYFYQDRVLSMLPKFTPRSLHEPFEPINDLPVHSATTAQLFYPTSESHQFNRVDAAKAFQDDLLPADARIPHPQMIEIFRDKKAGLSRTEIADRARLREEAFAKKREAMLARERRKEDATKKLEGRRWTFRISECDIEDVGKDGRGEKGVGWRYGVPFMDRKKGHLKIPTTAGL